LIQNKDNLFRNSRGYSSFSEQRDRSYFM